MIKVERVLPVRSETMVNKESRRFNKTVKFKNDAENIKIEIEKAINSHETGEGPDGVIIQLENTYKEIEQMIVSLKYHPTYPRVIVDTWDCNSELGKQLLDLYELYKQL